MITNELPPFYGSLCIGYVPSCVQHADCVIYQVPMVAAAAAYTVRRERTS